MGVGVGVLGIGVGVVRLGMGVGVLGIGVGVGVGVRSSMGVGVLGIGIRVGVRFGMGVGVRAAVGMRLGGRMWPLNDRICLGTRGFACRSKKVGHKFAPVDLSVAVTVHLLKSTLKRITAAILLPHVVQAEHMGHPGIGPHGLYDFGRREQAVTTCINRGEDCLDLCTPLWERQRRL
jgi:hypothetical protein